MSRRLATTQSMSVRVGGTVVELGFDPPATLVDAQSLAGVISTEIERLQSAAASTPVVAGDAPPTGTRVRIGDESFWTDDDGKQESPWLAGLTGVVDSVPDEQGDVRVQVDGRGPAYVNAGCLTPALTTPEDAGVSNLTLAYVVLAALVLGAAAPAGTAAFGLVAVAALAVLGLFGVRAAGAAVARRGGGR